MALGVTAYELILPNGVTRYVALGYSADLLAGTLSELVDSGYARKGHAAWVTDVTPFEAARKNNGAVVFDALVEGEKDIAWWGIFDAEVGGNLLAAGPVRNTAGVVESQVCDAGDQVRFNDGQLRLFTLPEDI